MSILKGSEGFLLPPKPWQPGPNTDVFVSLHLVPLNQLENVAKKTGAPSLPAGERLGFCIGQAPNFTMICVPTFETWEGTLEAWADNLRHEIGHALGWPGTHPPHA